MSNKRERITKVKKEREKRIRRREKEKKTFPAAVSRCWSHSLHHCLTTRAGLFRLHGCARQVCHPAIPLHHRRVPTQRRNQFDLEASCHKVDSNDGYSQCITQSAIWPTPSRPATETAGCPNSQGPAPDTIAADASYFPVSTETTGISSCSGCSQATNLPHENIICAAAVSSVRCAPLKPQEDNDR